MADILNQILDTKRNEVASLNKDEIEARLKDAPPLRDFTGALSHASSGGYGLIAELKKASPSAGLIREEFSPAGLAQSYEKGGATCLSVLTDKTYFQGELNHLLEAKEATASLPILRKDFFINPLQILEARAFGADAILIIMAAVDDILAAEIEKTASELGMATLIEVHNQHELDRAMTLTSSLIGINNRNLKTMQTDLKIAETLLAEFPKERIAIVESGLNAPQDLERMAKLGGRCFLIGEALMRHHDVTAATKTILGDMQCQN